MQHDLRMALLAGCIDELDARAASGRPRALDLLRQAETISPGIIERMAAGLQLARLQPKAAH